MNEISKIHLGRTAFTISTEAYKNLRLYLEDIRNQVKDDSVVEEVELRMAELLSEHGVGGDKVVLQADVDFIKEQLGDPQDFKEDDDDAKVAGKAADGKRLFRDTEQGMLAGVASGLAAYTGIDVLLVRVLFVIATLTGAWGLLVYIGLWLLVPEAKTSSERLQMAGKPITLESLKEIVERADVKGAAHRANNSLAGPINLFFRLVLRLLGIILIATGLTTLLGLLGGGIYVLLQHGAILRGSVFPVGFRENLLVGIAAAVLGITAIFMVLVGVALFRRNWPIRTWVTGLLIGFLCLGLATGGALAASVIPDVHSRYESNLHTTVRNVGPFDQVNVVGKGAEVEYVASDKYSLTISYYDHPELADIKTSVSNGILLIDTRQFSWHRDCPNLCIPSSYRATVTVSMPNPPQVNDDKPAFPVPPVKPGAPIPATPPVLDRS